MRIKTYRTSVLTMLVVLLAAPLGAQEWTRFRGPNGSGVSESSFSGTFEDFTWKTKLPGIGHAAPVIWGDKLFTLSADPDTATRYVVCLHAETGKQLWVREYPSQPHGLHDRSSYASSTPTVDEDRVYVAWSQPAETTLLALNHDGSDAWRLNLGRWQSQHGFGTSPILFEDMVIFFNSQDAENLKEGEQPGDTYMMAFERETGRELWRSPRKSTVVSYSVPCIYDGPQGPELICCQSNEAMFSLNPRTGKQNWAVDVFQRRTVSSPFLVGEMIFGSNGSGGGGNMLFAVHAGKKAELQYEVRKTAPYVPTSVAKDDAVFMVSDGGVASCIDAKTGEFYWNERIEGNYSGSLVRAADKVFVMDEEGKLVSFAADKKFKLHGYTPLGEPSRSTPAIANNKMYLRTYSHVICVDGTSP